MLCVPPRAWHPPHVSTHVSELQMSLGTGPRTTNQPSAEGWVGCTGPEAWVTKQSTHRRRVPDLQAAFLSVLTRRLLRAECLCQGLSPSCLRNHWRVECACPGRCGGTPHLAEDQQGLRCWFVAGGPHGRPHTVALAVSLEELRSETPQGELGGHRTALTCPPRAPNRRRGDRAWRPLRVQDCS